MQDISRILKRGKLYGITEENVRRIIKRDKVCIYCKKKMKMGDSVVNLQKDKATIEHFSNKVMHDENIYIGICCGSCNSSRSDHRLIDWFKKPYCIERNINEKTVAKPIKDYMLKKKGRC